MRKTLLAALLVFPLAAQAQDFIRYYAPAAAAFTGGAITSALAAPAADNCAAIPYSFTGDTNTGLCTSAADTWNLYTAGASRLSGNSTAVTSTVPFYGANGAVGTPTYTFTNDPDTGLYLAAVGQAAMAVGGAAYMDWTASQVRIFGGFDVVPYTSDATTLGLTVNLFSEAYVSRAIVGSKSKTLTDNTATAFVRLTVADDDYEGCGFGWTAYAEDADTDARQVRKGRTNVAILNTSGTESCNFSASTDDQAINVTAGTLTCTFDCTGGTNTVDLRATCDTSLDAAAETLTFEYRLDCESVITTITPQ